MRQVSTQHPAHRCPPSPLPPAHLRVQVLATLVFDVVAHPARQHLEGPLVRPILLFGVGLGSHGGKLLHCGANGGTAFMQPPGARN